VLDHFEVGLGCGDRRSCAHSGAGLLPGTSN
jgi:hypothetical protein